MLEYERLALSIPGDAKGFYLAYPTSSVLKPTYRGHKTMVNHDHTKVGITTSTFVMRENEYMRTFDHEIAFVPLLVVPIHKLASLEAQVLAELRNRYPLSGSAREWFRTTEREQIAHLVWKLAVDS